MIESPLPLEPVLEAAKYLTEPSARYYRALVGALYEQRELGKVWLTRDEVLQAVLPRWPADRAGPFTEVAADQYLTQLVEWGTLARQQDTELPTIEFWRKHLQFALTPEAVALERGLRELRARGNDAGALDPSLLEHLWRALQTVDSCLQRPISPEPSLERTALRTAWTGWISRFEELRRAGIDFQSTLLTQRDTPTVELAVLLTYKRALQHNLKAFGTRLREYTEVLREHVAQWDREAVTSWLAPAIARDDLETVARPGAPRELYELELQVVEQLAMVRTWCGPEGAGRRLADATVQAVQRAIQDTRRLQDQLTIGDSRRRDLARLAGLFASIESAEDAHRVAAVTLGALGGVHFQGDVLVADPSHDTWVEAPLRILVAPVQRGRRAKVLGAPVPDDTEEQARMVKAAAAEREEDRRLWSELLQDGPLRLTDVFLTTHRMRHQVAQVMAACLTSRDRTAYAPDGRLVRLARSEHPQLGCIRTRRGGAMWVPAYQMEVVRAGGIVVGARPALGTATRDDGRSEEVA